MNAEKRRRRAKVKGKVGAYMRNGGYKYNARLLNGRYKVTEKVEEDLKWLKDKRLLGRSCV